MRVGAGRPQKPLENKLLDGNITRDELQEDLNLPAIQGEVIEDEVVKVPEYFNELQRPDCNKDKQDPRERELIKIYKWVKELGCLGVVPMQLMEQYANNRVHWIEVQKLLAKTSYVYTKDGRVKINPLVDEYILIEKAMNNTFMLINQKVKENCMGEYTMYRPNDDIMKALID